MSQVFIWGASSAYGAGGGDGGWADLVKRELHRQMFSAGGSGEQHQVYVFAKSGATIEFVRKTYSEQLRSYRDPGRVIAVVSVGLNNSKASGTPDNFVCSPAEYTDAMHQLLADLQAKLTWS